MLDKQTQWLSRQALDMMKAYLVPTLFREIDGRTPMLHPAAVDEYIYIPSIPLTYFRDYASNLRLITQVASIRVACPSQGADLLFDRDAGGRIALEEDNISTGGCAGTEIMSAQMES